MVIGGTSGIGLSAGKAFVQQGAKVIALGLPGNTPHSDNWKYYIADATREGSAEIAIKMCIETFGGFDALFHVVGGSGRKWGDGPLHEITLEGWKKHPGPEFNFRNVFQPGCYSPFFGRKEKRKYFKCEFGPGFFPSSQTFLHPCLCDFKSCYYWFFLKQLLLIMHQKNIRVNVLAPGLTNTPMAIRAAKDKDIQNFIKTKQPLDGGRMAETSDFGCYSRLFPF